MSKNKKIITGLALAAAAFIIMMFSTMPSAGSKEITIKDLAENASKYQGDYIMTQGLLNKESVKWDADKLELRFEIYEEGQGTLKIFHKGIKPDNFSEDVIVLVEGFINKRVCLKPKRSRQNVLPSTRVKTWRTTTLKCIRKCTKMRSRNKTDGWLSVCI